MEKQKNINNISNKIEIKKNNSRGDEVAILFFSLIFLAFLIVSFFRLFAIGKLFDDFIFIFLFGWSKYLVYFSLFAFILPVFFNFYFKIKISFLLGVVIAFLIFSWIIQNIFLLSTTNRNIWWELSFYKFENLSSYFQTWWNSTIINNYHGFFSQPISFNNWKEINSFFPDFAAGGIVANFLIFLTSFGGFFTSFIISLILFFINFTWLLFSKPWFLFTGIFVFFVLIINYFKKKKNSIVQEKKIKLKKDKQKIIKENKNNQRNTIQTKQESKINSNLTEETEIKIFNQQDKNYFQEAPIKKEEKEVVIKNVLQESGMLTPFGKIDEKPKTITIDLENEIEDI